MAHSSTIFSQLLQLVSKHDFKRIEEKGFKTGRKARSLTRWSQFVAMMFAHLSGRSSLRDIPSQLGAHEFRPDTLNSASALSARLANFGLKALPAIEALHVTWKRCNASVACSAFSTQAHPLGRYQLHPQVFKDIR